MAGFAASGQTTRAISATPTAVAGTKKITSGMTKPTKAEALRQAALQLMENPETSRPFYWAGFVFVGEGGRDRKATPPRVTYLTPHVRGARAVFS